MLPLYTTATKIEKSAVAAIQNEFLPPAEVISLHDAPLSCDTHGYPPHTVAAICVKSAETQMPLQLLAGAAVIWFQVVPSSSDWYR